MHRHCGINNRAPRWTFTDPCKPEVRPGARKESAIMSGFHGAFATGVAYQQGTLTSGHLVPSPIVGLACAPTVETRFLELAMSLLDFSPRIPLGTFSILLLNTTRVPLQVDITKFGNIVIDDNNIWYKNADRFIQIKPSKVNVIDVFKDHMFVPTDCMIAQCARGESSKTKWLGINSDKMFSVRMDAQFSSFFFNIRKWIAMQRKNYVHSKMCMSMYKSL